MFSLFGVKINNLTLPEAVDKIEGFVNDGAKHLVVTANPEIIIEAKRNAIYLEALKSASLVVADGAGLLLASYLYQQRISKGRVTGVDLVDFLIKESGKRHFSVFLAGSTQSILNKTTHYFSSKYSQINIIGTYSFYSSEDIKNKNQDLTEEIQLTKILKEIKPDILLLAFGHPRQELWLYEHLAELPIKVGIGVGGAFDFISGKVRRAPAIVRRAYLEWLWRLLIQPWRIRRIIGAVILFPAAIISDLIRKKFHMEHNGSQ